MKLVHYSATIGAGRFTLRLEIVGNKSRLYRGEDCVAEYNPSSGAAMGTPEDFTVLILARDKILRDTAYLRN